MEAQGRGLARRTTAGGPRPVGPERRKPFATARLVAQDYQRSEAELPFFVLFLVLLNSTHLSLHFRLLDDVGVRCVSTKSRIRCQRMAEGKISVHGLSIEGIQGIYLSALRPDSRAVQRTLKANLSGLTLLMARLYSARMSLKSSRSVYFTMPAIRI